MVAVMIVSKTDGVLHAMRGVFYCFGDGHGEYDVSESQVDRAGRERMSKMSLL